MFYSRKTSSVDHTFVLKILALKHAQVTRDLMFYFRFRIHEAFNVNNSSTWRDIQMRRKKGKKSEWTVFTN